MAFLAICVVGADADDGRWLRPRYGTSWPGGNAVNTVEACFQSQYRRPPDQPAAATSDSAGRWAITASLLTQLNYGPTAQSPSVR